MDGLPYIPEVEQNPPTPINSVVSKINKTFENL